MAEQAVAVLVDALAALEAAVTDSIPPLKAEERKQAIRQADHDSDDIEEKIERAELEIRNCPKEDRGKWLKRVREVQHRLDLVQQTLNRLRMVPLTNHHDSSDEEEELLFADSADPQRLRLLVDNSRVERTGDRLRNAQRIAQETERIGVSVLDELSDQRDTILRVGISLDEADSNLARSRRTLRDMAIRACTSKVVWYLILAAVIMIVVLFIYIGLH